MTHQKFFGVVRHSILALALVGVAAQAAADNQYHVVIDTTSLAGAGWLDLQFNPGQSTAPAAVAALTGLNGNFDTAQAAQLSGDVTSAASSTVNFGNSTSYNDFFRAVNLGSKFSFDVTFSGAFLTTPGNVGSVFGLALYSGDQSSVLGNADAASGNVLKFDLTPAFGAGQFGSVSNTVYDSTLITVSAVPEPSEWMLMLSGIALLGLVARRRRAKQ
jgi:hypothetical protein